MHRAPRLVAIACFLLTLAALPASPPALPRPAPLARALDPIAANARCEGCHADVAAEWRASWHRRAYVDPAFQRALAIEPLPFCRACHAPEADPASVALDARHDLGVGCVTCHLPPGARGVLAGPGSARGAPHPVERDAAFAGAGACAGCHEFAFPSGSPEPSAAAPLMQSTVAEHRASPYAGVACASCHMATVDAGRGPHRDHRFDLQRSPASLRAALAVSVHRASATSAVFELRPIGVGHAFPTGDLFRRLEVSLEVVGPDASSLGTATRYLARHLVDRRLPNRVVVREVAFDDRPGAQPGAAARFILDAGARGAGRPLGYRVAYQRVLHPNTIDEADATLDGEVVLAEGTLSP